MTPEQIRNLKVGDRLMGPSYHKAEVIRRTTSAVEIEWEDGEKEFCALGNELSALTYIGPQKLGEPWLHRKPKPTGKAPRQARKSSRRVGRR
jgi:hypothetical protein